jgi:hypothetical protein
MHDGMFHPTDIYVYWHPLVYFLRAKRRMFVVSVKVPEEVPGRIEKGI